SGSTLDDGAAWSLPKYRHNRRGRRRTRRWGALESSVRPMPYAPRKRNPKRCSLRRGKCRTAGLRGNLRFPGCVRQWVLSWDALALSLADRVREDEAERAAREQALRYEAWARWVVDASLDDLANDLMNN